MSQTLSSVPPANLKILINKQTQTLSKCNLPTETKIELPGYMSTLSTGEPWSTEIVLPVGLLASYNLTV
jgi:hypothetical protein